MPTGWGSSDAAPPRPPRPGHSCGTTTPRRREVPVHVAVEVCIDVGRARRRVGRTHAPSIRQPLRRSRRPGARPAHRRGASRHGTVPQPACTATTAHHRGNPAWRRRLRMVHDTRVVEILRDRVDDLAARSAPLSPGPRAADRGKGLPPPSEPGAAPDVTRAIRFGRGAPRLRRSTPARPTAARSITCSAGPTTTRTACWARIPHPNGTVVRTLRPHAVRRGGGARRRRRAAGVPAGPGARRRAVVGGRARGGPATTACRCATATTSTPWTTRTGGCPRSARSTCT